MLSTPGVNSFACMLCTNFKMPSKMSKSKSSKKGGKGITPKNVSKDQMQHLLQDIKKLNLPRDKVALNDVLEGVVYPVVSSNRKEKKRKTRGWTQPEEMNYCLSLEWSGCV